MRYQQRGLHGKMTGFQAAHFFSPSHILAHDCSSLLNSGVLTEFA